MSTTDRGRGSFARWRLSWLMAVWLASACGATSSDPGGTGGGSDGGTPPPDAGLSPDAKIEDCVSDEGARICGTETGCYEHGASCECEPVPPNSGEGPTVAFGLCSDYDLPSRLCGICHDGEVCVVLGVDPEFAPMCVTESLGRLFWLHGRGGRVMYADWTPYTGEPLPEPTECPPPNGQVTLCGGNCGGCDAGRVCSGRSPTHPYGICVEDDLLHCSADGTLFPCNVKERCLMLTSGPPVPQQFYPSLCVEAASCAAQAASVPGGALYY